MDFDGNAVESWRDIRERDLDRTGPRRGTGHVLRRGGLIAHRRRRRRGRWRRWARVEAARRWAGKKHDIRHRSVWAAALRNADPLRAVGDAVDAREVGGVEADFAQLRRERKVQVVRSRAV